MTLYVLYPDFAGEGTVAGFAERISELYPTAQVVAVVNGGNPPELPSRERFTVLRSERDGVVGALTVGYQYCMERDDLDVVVRLDTAEHPLEQIQEVADRAAAGGGCIGDLDCRSVQVVGSVDEYAQSDVVPALFAAATGGGLVLGGAHGMQGWRGDKLEVVFGEAASIHAAAAERFDGPLRWGFDAAMALAGLEHCEPLEVRRIDAEGPRNRQRSKVTAQVAAIAAVACSAAAHFDRRH